MGKVGNAAQKMLKAVNAVAKSKGYKDIYALKDADLEQMQGDVFTAVQRDLAPVVRAMTIQSYSAGGSPYKTGKVMEAVTNPTISVSAGRIIVKAMSGLIYEKNPAGNVYIAMNSWKGHVNKALFSLSEQQRGQLYQLWLKCIAGVLRKWHIKLVKGPV